MKNNNILLSVLLLLLSGVVVLVMSFGLKSDDKVYSETQQITFRKGKSYRKAATYQENVSDFAQLQSKGAIGTGETRQAGSTTFRVPTLKREGDYRSSYLQTQQVSAPVSGGVAIATQSGSLYGRTSSTTSSGDTYAALAPLSGGRATVNPVSVGQMFYAPQATNNGSVSGVNRAYTSTMVEIGAPISALSAVPFTGAHTHVDNDGDGYCDLGDGFYLDYRPGDGTGEWEEVWVPLGDDTPLLVMCLLSLVIAYFKFRK
ncbi:MAG: hypothetical protein ACI3ZZ_01140 [Candidatus Aphodosoma sp.]